MPHVAAATGIRSFGSGIGSPLVISVVPIIAWSSVSSIIAGSSREGLVETLSAGAAAARWERLGAHPTLAMLIATSTAVTPPMLNFM